MLTKVKSVLAAHRDRQILEQDPTAVPSEAAFSAFYEGLFRADGNLPHERFHNARKPVSAVDDDEKTAFSTDALRDLIRAIQPKKAITRIIYQPICSGSVRDRQQPWMLSRMFRVL